MHFFVAGVDRRISRVNFVLFCYRLGLDAEFGLARSRWFCSLYDVHITNFIMLVQVN